MNTSKRYDSQKAWYAIHTYSGYEEKSPSLSASAPTVST
jgi:hypothetical protein